MLLLSLATQGVADRIALRIDEADPRAVSKLTQLCQTLGMSASPHFPADPDPQIDQRLRVWWLVDAGSRPHQLVERLKGQPWVKAWDHDATTHISIVPDDPLYPDQWALSNSGQARTAEGFPVGIPGYDLGMEPAWDLISPEISPVIAVLDTGIDPDHPEFHGRLLPGFNFLTNLPGAVDDNGHGTAVASLIGARGNNGEGMAGLAWTTRLLPLKVFNSIGQGSASALANALNFARQQAVTVVNYSGGMESDYGPAADMIDILREQGILTVAAAGNQGVELLDFPARHEGCLAIGAMSPCGERVSPTSCDQETSWGSSYGDNLFCIAPGVLLTGALRGGGYRENFRGTSAACAYISGGIALMLAAQPELGIEELLQVLADNSTDLAEPGRDAFTGWGLPDLNAALRQVLPLQVTDLRIRSFGNRIRLDWTPVVGALSYRIEACNRMGEPFQTIAERTLPGWTSEAREIALPSRCYRVRAVLQDSESATLR